MIVFHAHGKLRGHEEQASKVIGILRAEHAGVALRAAVAHQSLVHFFALFGCERSGFGLFEKFRHGGFTASVVTFALYLHERGEGIDAVARVGRDEAVVQTSRQVVVAKLFGRVCIVRLVVKTISAAAELARVVQFGRQPRKFAQARKAAQAHVVPVELRHFRIAVAVAVVRRAVVQLPEEGQTELIVVGHIGGIDIGVVLKRVQPADAANLVRHRGRGSRGIFRDHIDHPGDGRRTEECRTAAAHHLDALDHVGRNLFQTVDTRQTAEHGTRIDEHLRVGAVEPVDAHLRETAVLAIVFHAHAGLELQRLREERTLRVVKDFGIEHIHQRRGQSPFRHIAGGRHHHIAERQLGHEFEVRHQRGIGGGGHLVCLRHKAGHVHFDLQGADREIFEHVVPRHVGRHRNVLSFHRHRNMGQELARGRIAHMPHNVCRPVVGSGQHRARSRKEGEQQKQKEGKYFSHILFYTIILWPLSVILCDGGSPSVIFSLQSSFIFTTSTIPIKG